MNKRKVNIRDGGSVVLFCGPSLERCLDVAFNVKASYLGSGRDLPSSIQLVPLINFLAIDHGVEQASFEESGDETVAVHFVEAARFNILDRRELSDLRSFKALVCHVDSDVVSSVGLFQSFVIYIVP